MYYFFFFNDTATTEIYTLSLHDALPICTASRFRLRHLCETPTSAAPFAVRRYIDFFPPSIVPTKHRFRSPACTSARDRKSTRLNSSHSQISYAVFCLKKKNKLCMDTQQT